MKRLSGVLATLILASSATATTWLVRPDGTGDYPTIQAAVSVAQPGDEIVLTDGVFQGDGNRDVDFLGKAITIRSLSGHAEACLIDCQGSEGERHRAFNFASAEDSTSVLDGIGVTGGYEATGGAIYCGLHAYPKFLGCLFFANHGNYGGAVYGEKQSIYGAAPIVRDCVFRENSATDGGGLRCAYDFQRLSEITRCTFDGNSATEYGGGANLEAARVRGCTFIRNHVDDPMLCAGGGLYAYDCTVEECRFEANASRRGAGGCAATSTTITSCVFEGNQAVYGGAGLSAAATDITGCTFQGNSASSYGGGIASGGGAVNVNGVTLVENSAPTGSALAAEGFSSATLERCIIAFNRTGPALASSMHSRIYGDCDDLYGNFAGNGAWPDGENSFSADPIFCGAANQDAPLTLRDDSPCAPENNPTCGLVGAWPVGCVSGSAVGPQAPVAASPLRVSPNPARGEVAFEFALPPGASAYSLTVYDAAGREIRTLRGTGAPGARARVSWDGRDHQGQTSTAGAYYGRLHAGDMTAGCRWILVR
jgi:hypothetical protein